jgi:hypothetical protein
MDFRDQTIEDQEVELDGNVFTGCTFRRCRFVFRATDSVVMSVCRLVDCTWKAGGSAANTIKFLSEMYHYVEGGREIVEQTFEGIRKGI